MMMFAPAITWAAFGSVAALAIAAGSLLIAGMAYALSKKTAGAQLQPFLIVENYPNATGGERLGMRVKNVGPGVATRLEVVAKPVGESIAVKIETWDGHESLASDDERGLILGFNVIGSRIVDEFAHGRLVPAVILTIVYDSMLGAPGVLETEISYGGKPSLFEIKTLSHRRAGGVRWPWKGVLPALKKWIHEATK